MKKFITLAAISMSFALPAQTYASENLVSDVEAFYKSFETTLNTRDFETTRSIVNEHFAEDFAHYDDGVNTYGKTGLLDFINQSINNRVSTRLDIDMKSVKFSEEQNEIHAHFVLDQDILTPSPEQNKNTLKPRLTLKLECFDQFRITESNSFELYKCDCKTLKRTQH